MIAWIAVFYLGYLEYLLVSKLYHTLTSCLKGIFSSRIFICSISDTEDPIIYCPANQTMVAAPGFYATDAVWADPLANDNSGIATTVLCNFESGGQFRIGHTRVVCEARDASGNQAICTFIIEVIGNKIIN